MTTAGERSGVRGSPSPRVRLRVERSRALARLALLSIVGGALLGAGCGGSSTESLSGPVSDSPPPAVAPPDAPGRSNQVAASPAVGESRSGLTYDVYIQVPATGDTMAFTVMEPMNFEGGRKYPLVLHSHGFSQSRSTSPDCPGCITGLDENLRLLVDNGYGVISIDERGHGESSGQIRLMDPDYEGKDLIAILDWAEARLDWLAYGPSPDGRDPRNLIVGAVGGSYGGAFQLTINAIDPGRRLDAIVPEITFYSLLHALAPNGVIRAGWDLGVFAAGMSAGSGLDRAHYDPFVTQFVVDALTTNKVSPEGADFFTYHGHNYFCEGQPVATNGGPGTAPELAPVHPPKVHAMFWQGMRDPLFGLEQAYWNAQCLREAGGDVRLLSYQAGHNAITPFLDAGGQLFQPPAHFINDDCGTLDVHVATLAFFAEHLKGIQGAADSVPHNCISLTSGDAVVVDEITTGRDGTQAVVPATTMIAGVLDLPIAVDLGIVAGPDGDVLGGLPHLALHVQPVNPGTPGEAIIFAGIGHMRASVPGVWDLVDNQLTPLRGTGDFDLPMVAVGERLAPGDRVGLLLYGGHQQYFATGSINAAQPTVMPVEVEGRVWVPMLGPQAAQQ